MFPDIFGFLQDHFTSHGYWTLAIALLLENAGVPVPGETVLLFASFLAHEHEELSLEVIILLGTLACTLGDNLGYWLGHCGGRPFLDRHRRLFHLSDRTISRGEKLFHDYGSVTILFARFIFGMRVIAGPLAGVLAMPWRKFAIYNFLGAACWVTTVSSIGYGLGHH
ncbi:MAG TPA: DedA family protein, partial [Terriglobales bacterium]|nr:DedA family protein [Terriglobales bacterium]